MQFSIEAIGYIRGGTAAAIDDDWGQNQSVIKLDHARFEPDALAGLSEFSHAEIVFVFDRVLPEQIETGARHPRGREDWPLTGIFA